MIFVIIIFFIYYVVNLCPTVYVGDSGEFITSAFVLGIPHPPSFPLYVILGRIFSLIPLGNIAYRVNLMSAFFGALTCGILYTVIQIIQKKIYSKFILIGNEEKNEKLSGDITLKNNESMQMINRYNEINKFQVNIISRLDKYCIPFIVTLYFGLAPVFISEATVSEVFTLNSFLTAVLIYLVLFFKKPGYLIFLIAGLSLGNHHTIIFVFPGILIFFIFKYRDFIKNSYMKPVKFTNPVLSNFPVKKYFGVSVLFFLLGLSLYIVPYFRTKYEPVFNVGRPYNLERLYRVFTRRDYGTFNLSLDSEKKISVKKYLITVKEFIKLKYKNFGLIIILLFIFGLYFLFKIDFKLFLLLSLSYFFSGLFFYLISNMPDNAQTWHLLKRFNIMTYFFVSIIFSVCLVRVVNKYTANERKMKGNMRSTGKYGNYFYFLSATFILLLLLLFVTLILRMPLLISKRNVFNAFEYGMNSLLSMKKNSIFIMDGGDDIFYTAAYIKTVLGPDCNTKLYDTGGIVFTNTIYGLDYRTIPKKDRDIRRESIEKDLIINKRIPVYYSTMNPERFNWLSLKPSGLIYTPDKNQLNPDNIWGAYSERGIYLPDEDYRLRSVNAVFPYFKALYYKDKMDLKNYINYLKMTKKIGKDIDWVLGNITVEVINCGKELLKSGKYESANYIFSEGININPDSVVLFMLLGNSYLEKKDINNAYLTYSKAKKNFSGNSDIHNNLGVILGEYMKQPGEAEKEYLQAIYLNDSNIEAHYNLSVLYWKQNKWDKVVQELNKVIQYSPDDIRAKRFLPQAQMQLNLMKK